MKSGQKANELFNLYKAVIYTGKGDSQDNIEAVKFATAYANEMIDVLKCIDENYWKEVKKELTNDLYHIINNI